jgi:hypothetical protein
MVVTGICVWDREMLSAGTSIFEIKAEEVLEN